MSRLLARPDFAGTRTFRAWNIFGILDLIDAVGTGALISVFAGSGEISTSPMAQMPLVLIPAFLVPIALMLHTVALLKTRGLRLAGRHMWPVPA